MNRLGCSTGSLGCVIDIVFIAPSFSCHSSSLHTKTFYLFLEQFIYFAVFKQSENRGKQSKTEEKQRIDQELQEWMLKFESFLSLVVLLPVSFIGRRNILWEPPLAHLKDAEEEHRVDAKNTWRNSHAHDSACAFSRVAEVVSVWERLEIGVETCGALDRQIR